MCSHRNESGGRGRYSSATDSCATPANGGKFVVGWCTPGTKQKRNNNYFNLP